MVATGRLRTAGYLVSGGGIGLLLSTILPWASALGIDAHQSGGAIILLLAIGGGLTFLGYRVLEDKVTRKMRIILWVLAGVDTVLVLGLFSALSDTESGLAEPAIGFYVGLLALVASIAGTVVLQMASRETAAP